MKTVSDAAALFALPTSLDTANPKDLMGSAKPPLSLVPPAAIIHAAMAMKDGEKKYGAFNWRKKQVQALIYLDAAKRHLDSFLDGEDYAKDSGVHHLGHAIACCAILLDAMETGNLIDNRPTPGKAAEIIARLTKVGERPATAPEEVGVFVVKNGAVS